MIEGSRFVVVSHVDMRDERIGAVVNLFGATEFFLFQADAEDLLRRVEIAVGLAREEVMGDRRRMI